MQMAKACMNVQTSLALNGSVQSYGPEVNEMPCELRTKNTVFKGIPEAGTFITCIQLVLQYFVFAGEGLAFEAAPVQSRTKGRRGGHQGIGLYACE